MYVLTRAGNTIHVLHIQCPQDHSISRKQVPTWPSDSKKRLHRRCLLANAAQSGNAASLLVWQASTSQMASLFLAKGPCPRICRRQWHVLTCKAHAHSNDRSGKHMHAGQQHSFHVHTSDWPALHANRCGSGSRGHTPRRSWRGACMGDVSTSAASCLSGSSCAQTGRVRLSCQWYACRASGSMEDRLRLRSLECGRQHVNVGSCPRLLWRHDMVAAPGPPHRQQAIEAVECFLEERANLVHLHVAQV